MISAFAVCFAVFHVGLQLISRLFCCVYDYVVFMGAQFGFSSSGIPALVSYFSAIFLNVVVVVFTAFGLPQVIELCLWVSMGMLSVKHFAQKFLMAVGYYG